MATKRNPGKWDCYANAHPDEPMFILLGRDLVAPWLVGIWRAMRARDYQLAKNILATAFNVIGEQLPAVKTVPLYSEKSQEADQCASAMREWYLKPVEDVGLPYPGELWEKEVKPPNSEEVMEALRRGIPVSKGPGRLQFGAVGEPVRLRAEPNQIVCLTVRDDEVDIEMGSGIKVHIASRTAGTAAGRLGVSFTGLGADGYCFPQQIIANGVDILYGFKKAVPNDPNTGTGGKAGDDQRPG
jgi:hypothetical protein